MLGKNVARTMWVTHAFDWSKSLAELSAESGASLRTLRRLRAKSGVSYPRKRKIGKPKGRYKFFKNMRLDWSKSIKQLAAETGASERHLRTLRAKNENIGAT
jgi:AraC-like DNA-binding protein